MAKSKTTGGVQVTEMGAGETVWTEVAKVAIKRGSNGRGDTPLMLTQHIGDGKLASGRCFNLALNLGSGALVVTLEKTRGDKSRAYIVDPRDMLEAIIEKEFPG